MTTVCSSFPHHPPQKNVYCPFYDCQMVDPTDCKPSIIHGDRPTSHKTGRLNLALSIPAQRCGELQTSKRPTVLVPVQQCPSVCLQSHSRDSHMCWKQWRISNYCNLFIQHQRRASCFKRQIRDRSLP